MELMNLEDGVLDHTRWPEIHEAAIRGRVDTVKKLLEEGVPIDARDDFDYTPLHRAAESDSLEMVEFIINEKSNLLEMKTRVNRCTPLLCAADAGHKNVVDVLIRYGADLQARCHDRLSLLHHASKWEWFDIIEMYADKNYNLEMKAFKGNTPLLYAAEKGRKDAVDMLIRYGADLKTRDSAGVSLLHYASMWGWFDIIEVYVDNNCFEVAAFLDNEKCNLEMKTAYAIVEGTPLLCAANKGRKDVVDVLIRYGADLHARDGFYGLSLLHYASRWGWLDIVEMYVDNKIMMEQKCRYGRTPLLEAAFSGKKDVVDLLIRSGADLHCRDTQFGQDLLYFASKHPWLDVVEICVKNKCDLDQKYENEKTPLLCAAGFGNKDVVCYFVEKGADIHVSDDSGDSLFHYASAEGWLDVMEMCVTNKLDVNRKNAKGNTPLHFSLNVDTVKYLLESGAEFDAKDVTGYTAFIYVLCELPISSIVESMVLFINRGFCFEQQSDYAVVLDKRSFKDLILKNSQICYGIIVNRFNYYFLPKFYEMYKSYVNLPFIDSMKITDTQNVAHEVQKCVELEIETNEHCDIMRFNPMVLKMLCVKSLITKRFTNTNNV